MHSRRLIRLTAAALAGYAVLTSATAPAAWAKRGGPQAGATPGAGNGVDLGVGVGTSSGGGGGSGGGGKGGSKPGCTMTPIPPTALQDPTTLFTSNGTPIPAGTPGKWVVEYCPGGNGATFFLPAGGGGAAIDPAGAAQELRDHLPLPAPPVQLNPPASGWQYTGVPMWMWVPASEWRPLTDSLAVDGVSVTVTARPEHITYRIENGRGGNDEVVCRSAGTPFDSSRPGPLTAASPDCGYLWTRSAASSADERLGIRAVVTYTVTWTTSGAPGGGTLPPLDSFPFSVRVTVGQIQALITGGG